jgi:hypothetical protein
LHIYVFNETVPEYPAVCGKMILIWKNCLEPNIRNLETDRKKMNLRLFPLSIHDLHELGFSKMEEEHLFFDLFSRSARRRSRARSTITQTLLIQVYGQQYPTSVNDMCRSNGSFWHSSTTRPSLIPTSYNTHCFVPDVASLPLFSSYVYSLEMLRFMH